MNLKKIIVIVLVLYAVVAGFIVGTPWIRNEMFANEMDDQARLMHFGTAQRARSLLMEAAHDFKIPIKDEDLVVIRDEASGRIFVEAKYSVTVILPGGLYTHTWNFHPTAQSRIPKVTGPGF